LNQQNTGPKRKNQQMLHKTTTIQRRTRRQQSEKTKQKYEETCITTYLNKKRDKNGVEGLFQAKNG
jgi:hypothetical protein